jgi:acyl carrier protein
VNSDQAAGNSEKMYTRHAVAVIVSETLLIVGLEWVPGRDAEHVHLFDDLGIDSLDGYDVAFMLEQKLGSASEEQNFASTFTIRSVIESACELLKRSGRFIEG